MSLARRCLLDLLGPAGDEDGLIDQVEDDRAHREAERVRQRADISELGVGPFAEGQRQLILGLADLVDPYEIRDGQLVRKSDGKPVII